MNSVKDMSFYARRFMDSVLAIPNMEMVDYPGGALRIDPDTNKPWVNPKTGKRQMMLPLTRKSLARMFGPEIEERISDDSFWSLLGALIFHELGHDISPETFGSGTKMLSFYENIINDCNETTVIPRRWPGSVSYFSELYALVKAIAQGIEKRYKPDPKDPKKAVRIDPDKEFKSGSIEEARYYHDMLDDTFRQYRGLLTFKWEGEWVTEYPEDHVLHNVFHDLKPIIYEARSYWEPDEEVFAETRLQMAKDMYERIKKWWVEEMGQDEDTFERPEPPPSGGGGALGGLGMGGGGSVGGGTGSGPDLEDMTDEEIAEMQEALDEMDLESGVGDAADDFDKMKDDKAAEDRAKEEKEDKELEDKFGKKSLSMGDKRGIPAHLKPLIGGGGYAVPPTHSGRHTIKVSESAVMQLRRYLKILIHERKLGSRKAVKRGTSLYPPNFYQIKTDIKRAEVMTDNLAMDVGDARTDIVMLFDRSGSMCSTQEWGTSADVARNVMAHLYMGTWGIKEINLVLGGFGDGDENDNGLLDMVHPGMSREDTLKMIYDVLTPNAGNNLPAAIKVGLDMLELSKAPRKYLMLLHDGDEWGTYNLDEQYRRAKRMGVKIFIFGIDGAPRAKSVTYADAYTFVDNPIHLPKYFQRMIKDAVK
jgi:hypothetical protein